MRRIATIDCETDPFKNGESIMPFIWDVFDGEEHHTFEDTAHAVAFLVDKEWIVYAHNGGKFDYHQPHFLDELEKYQELTIINGRLAKFRLGLCEFRDSYNILPMPLAAWKKDDFDYAKMHRDVRHKYRREILKYLKNDTEYLYEIVKAFIDEYGLNLTLAGAAMKQWKKMNHEIPADDGTVFHRITPFYVGGRVEAFQHGTIKGDINSYDINSAYPYAMLHKHPYGLGHVVRDFSGTVVGDGFYIVHCVARGCFPYRGEKLSFPDDDIRREYHVTGWELLAALETETMDIQGHSIRQEIIFTKTQDFSQYVNHFYEMKNNAPKDSAQRIFAKFLLNTLYGVDAPAA